MKKSRPYVSERGGPFFSNFPTDGRVMVKKEIGDRFKSFVFPIGSDRCRFFSVLPTAPPAVCS